MILTCLGKCIIRSRGWAIYVDFINHNMINKIQITNIISYLKTAIIII